MFEDIELSIGEVLPTASITTEVQAGTIWTCTDTCTCMTQCCKTTAVCC